MSIDPGFKYGTQCTICLDEIEKANQTILKCEHSFHAKCLKNLIDHGDVAEAIPCPNCKETSIRVNELSLQQPEIFPPHIRIQKIATWGSHLNFKSKKFYALSSVELEFLQKMTEEEREETLQKIVYVSRGAFNSIFDTHQNLEGIKDVIEDFRKSLLNDDLSEEENEDIPLLQSPEVNEEVPVEEEPGVNGVERSEEKKEDSNEAIAEEQIEPVLPRPLVFSSGRKKIITVGAIPLTATLGTMGAVTGLIVNLGRSLVSSVDGGVLGGVRNGFLKGAAIGGVLGFVTGSQAMAKTVRVTEKVSGFSYLKSKEFRRSAAAQVRMTNEVLKIYKNTSPVIASDLQDRIEALEVETKEIWNGLTDKQKLSIYAHFTVYANAYQSSRKKSKMKIDRMLLSSLIKFEAHPGAYRKVRKG